MKNLFRSRVAQALWEAFDVSRRDVGQLKFRQSQISDKHIRDIINQASAKTGVPAADIDKKLQKYISEIEEFKKYSYVLYDTMAKNAVENSAFDLIEHSRTTTFPKFDVKIFHELVDMVQLEHEQFFPLRAPGEITYIYTFDPILVPSKNKKWIDKGFNDVSTAAATAQGEFIFNVDFMQKLMDWATAEGLKPKAKKYESNGGPIPDCYAYIEFLIVHELLHYSYGDFAAGKRLKQYSHQVHNWASDFRSNYMLVKNGYEQLPLGLFSDHINYDRQGSYDDMVELVDAELKKLPKPLQDKFQQLADSFDDHEKSTQKSQPGSGEPGEEKPGQDGEPGDAKGEQKQPGGVPSQDQIQKDIEKKMSERKEVGSEEEMEKARQEQRAKDAQAKAGEPGKDGYNPLKDISQEIGRQEPRNWKQLIKEMVMSTVPKKQSSYAKPSRKAVVGASVAAQLGAGAMKPGYKTLEDQERKLCLVFDTSGSMYNTIVQVMRLVPGLLQQANVSRFPLGVIFFAGDAEYYTVNIGENWYAQVSDFTKLGKDVPKGDRKKPYGSIFTMRGGGGTVLSVSIAEQCAQLANQGFNVVVFSDTDILSGDNWKVFSNMFLSHKRNVFFIADSKSTWAQACQQAGQTPPGWSYVK